MATRLSGKSATVTIAASGTTSGSVRTSGKIIKGIVLPVTTGTAFTVEVSLDDATWYPLNVRGNTAISITKTAGTATAYPLESDYTAGWPFIRVVSGSTEASARSITFIAE